MNLKMKNVAIAAGVALVFGYGFALGKYAIFPYSTIYELKHKYFTSETSDTVRNATYLYKRDMYKEFHGKGDYVMVGDSITENARWDDIFPNYKIVNRGIAGDDTTGILERIDDIIATGAKKAFIMVGTNDIDRGMSADGIVENIGKIADKLKEAGMDIVVESTLFSGETLRQKNIVINQINNKLTKFCKEKSYHYVDINKSLAVDGVLNPEFSLDDTHINFKGYKAWSNEISDLF
ncbi:GDSL-type esterase/lipase family protein [Chimaeribacter arupi]|uniref:GDSL-type esterase/lipase family protein n=1 Tax=Chimaeribacter arupi TaxID=2060066 RepID=UPI000C7B2211|nr:GDSL-type esterase/lipase family protein [Chimaeribacter arupi]PLR52066.1 hypothetical protein CYR52_08280 [Chimaeribacter arupi]